MNTMEKSTKLCMGCMREISDVRKCPYCGYIEESQYHPRFLGEKTLLKEQYIVGRSLLQNDEGITYIGYDVTKSQRVLVREYMPDMLCQRASSGNAVVPRKGCQDSYEKYEKEFVILSKKMVAVKQVPGVMSILDLFLQNGTVYAIYQYEETMAFSEFLGKNVGELTLEQTKFLFVPLLESLGKLHEAGVIHGSISPAHVLINTQGDLILGIPSIYSACSHNSDFANIVAPGYAAPEQYEQNGKVTKRSDIYAVCALIYRSLTGTMPPEAYGRQKNDNTLTIQKINPSIPLDLSDAISKGMAFRSEERYDTVDPILNSLRHAKSVPVAPVVEPVREVPVKREREERASAVRSYETVRPKRRNPNRRRGRFPYALVSWFVSLLLIGAVAGTLFYDLYGEKVDEIFGWNFYRSQNLGDMASDLLDLPEQTDSDGDTGQEDKEGRIQVPVFVGQISQAVLENQDYTSQFVFQVQESSSSQYGAGVIIEQEPQANSFVDNTGELISVTLVVSTGGQTVQVPDILGEDISTASEELTQRGIQADIVYVYDNEADEGTVLRMDFPVNTEIDPSSVTLTVYVAKNYEVEEPSESEGTLTLRDDAAE